MASVFLSYDHEDGALAAPIAAALEDAGHSVWWDRYIHGGAEYNSEIESAVERADAVVVLWSERSVKSAWVRDEAAEGRDEGKLVPVSLDDAKPPMGFRQYQTIRLSRRRSRKAPPDIAQLLHAIDTLTGTKSDPGSLDKTPAIGKPRLRLGWAIAAASITTLTVIGLFLWRPWSSEAASTVAISAADRSAASQSYARDLLVQLGELQSANPNALQLVGPELRKDAGLVFEVTGTTEGQLAHANLVLVDGAAGGLIWSSSFERPISQSGDLRKQLGYAAATVLKCAVDAQKGGRHALERDVLKQYLNGCAELSAGDGQASPTLIAAFRRVLAAAPRFEGGWIQLLRAEANSYVAGNSELKPDIQHDIAAARRVNPRMSAAYLAQFDLLPDNAFGQRLSLVDRAIASDPEYADAVAFRSEALFAVGRVRESLDAARRAVELDPVTPHIRGNYVTSLAQSGRTQGALDEISKAERIWPSSDAVTAARFSIHLRYGDPRIAWQMIQAGEVNAAWIDARSFLKARMTRKSEDIDIAIKDAKAFYAIDPSSFHHVVQTFTILDREDQLLPILMTVPLNDASSAVDVMFRPSAHEFWRDPKSLQYAKRVGLLGYWQSSGNWPDFCYEADLPYDCKAEAAKLPS